MKKLLLLFLSLPIYSQVGIGTTEPTNTLDVNGTLRVRSLSYLEPKSNGTVQTNAEGVFSYAPYKAVAMGVIANDGTILKAFGISSVVKLNSTTYKITFSTPLDNNLYIINLTAKDSYLNYRSVENTGFQVYVNQDTNTISSFDFNFTVFKIN